MLNNTQRNDWARSACLILGAVSIASTIVCSGASADGRVNTGYFGGVAIDGYDPVAYFTENRAVKGSEKYSYVWLGAPWHFANQEHRDLFKQNPVKYAPQYGGYCAAEVAGSGSVTVNIDPEAFAIIDGKLYLTYDKVHTGDFAAHISDVAPKAEANWPKKEAELAQDNYR
jgi:YHS domain-containing protein